MGAYEKARAREDSLDRLVEWPAQRMILGDVAGKSVLDLGCGNGGKLIELVYDGAVDSVGVDVSKDFVMDKPQGLELINGNLSNLGAIPELSGRKFDRVLFLQSFGYTPDPVRTLMEAKSLLTDDDEEGVCESCGGVHSFESLLLFGADFDYVSLIGAHQDGLIGTHLNDMPDLMTA